MYPQLVPLGLFDGAVEAALKDVLSAVDGFVSWLVTASFETFLVFQSPHQNATMRQEWWANTELALQLFPLVVALGLVTMPVSDLRKAAPHRQFVRAVKVLVYIPIAPIFLDIAHLGVTFLMVRLLPKTYEIPINGDSLTQLMQSAGASVLSALFGASVLVSLSSGGILSLLGALRFRMFLWNLLYMHASLLIVMWYVDWGPLRYMHQIASLIVRMAAYTLLVGVLIAMSLSAGSAVGGTVPDGASSGTVLMRLGGYLAGLFSGLVFFAGGLSMAGLPFARRLMSKFGGGGGGGGSGGSGGGGSDESSGLGRQLVGAAAQRFDSASGPGGILDDVTIGDKPGRAKAALRDEIDAMRDELASVPDDVGGRAGTALRYAGRGAKTAGSVAATSSRIGLKAGTELARGGAYAATNLDQSPYQWAKAGYSRTRSVVADRLDSDGSAQTGSTPDAHVSDVCSGSSYQHARDQQSRTATATTTTSQHTTRSSTTQQAGQATGQTTDTDGATATDSETDGATDGEWVDTDAPADPDSIADLGVERFVPEGGHAEDGLGGSGISGFDVFHTDTESVDDTLIDLSDATYHDGEGPTPDSLHQRGYLEDASGTRVPYAAASDDAPTLEDGATYDLGVAQFHAYPSDNPDAHPGVDADGDYPLVTAHADTVVSAGPADSETDPDSLSDLGGIDAADVPTDERGPPADPEIPWGYSNFELFRGDAHQYLDVENFSDVTYRASETTPESVHQHGYLEDHAGNRAPYAAVSDDAPTLEDGETYHLDTAAVEFYPSDNPDSHPDVDGDDYPLVTAHPETEAVNAADSDYERPTLDTTVEDHDASDTESDDHDASGDRDDDTATDSQSFDGSYEEFVADLEDETSGADSGSDDDS